MSSNVSSDPETVTLTVRKGSVRVPLMILLISAFLFVVYALPSDYGRLAQHLGFMGGPPPPTSQEILARVADILTEPDAASRNSVWQRVDGDPWTFASEVAHPLLKAFLEQLSADFRLIVSSPAGTIGTLALYALPVGLVGLIYRRRFWFWFLSAFAALLAIDISGIFPLPQHAVISETVFKRMVDSLPLYAPQALFDLNDALDKRRDLIGAQVETLAESGLLSDEDLAKIEGYRTRLHLNRFDEYWQNQVLARRAGKFDSPQKALTNEPAAAEEEALSAPKTAAAPSYG